VTSEPGKGTELHVSLPLVGTEDGAWKQHAI
jgi:hypothetical protein